MIYYEADTGLAGGEQVEKTIEQEKTFTQAELNDIIAKQRAKFEEVTEKKIAGFKEAEKLKGMSADERTMAELEQARERIAQFEVSQLETQYRSELLEKGLPASFAKVLQVNDAEKAKLSIDSLTSFKLEIEKPLNDKIKDLEEQLKNASIRGNAPPASTGGQKIAKAIPTTF